jgi:hypothetical protein
MTQRYVPHFTSSRWEVKAPAEPRPLERLAAPLELRPPETAEVVSEPCLARIIHDSGTSESPSNRVTRIASFEVALLGFITLPLGGSAAVAAGEGPLRALRPDSPGGRVTNERTHSSRVSPSEIHKPEAKSATSRSVSEGGPSLRPNAFPRLRFGSPSIEIGNFETHASGHFHSSLIPARLGSSRRPGRSRISVRPSCAVTKMALTGARNMAKWASSAHRLFCRAPDYNNAAWEPTPGTRAVGP